MSCKRGFTLIELLVVLVILVALAGLILPRISGVSEQAESATKANTLAGVNNAIGRYEAQYSKLPTAGDGILEGDGPTRTFYSKLHPNLVPLLEAKQLTAEQIRSLDEAGIKGVHFQDPAWTSAASDSGQLYASLRESFGAGPLVAPGVAGSWCFLKLDRTTTPATFPGHNIQFPDKAFSINLFKAERWASEYVVIGLGKEMATAGSVMADVPVFQSASPEKYYARALCVFRVPGATQSYFKAQYIGSFAPDGTCIQDNINNYHSSKESGE